MKRKSRFFIFISCIMCFLFALVGCNNNAGNTSNGGNNEDTGTYYTVTFDSQGGSAIESQRVLEGNTVRSPETPTRENYYFIGWYRSTDENAVEWYFSTDRVNSDITLYAKWQADETQIETESLTYERNTSGYTVTGADGQEERIIIPAEHDGLPVTEIGESAFAYSRHTSGITYVLIPDTVEKIGLNAFYNRSELVTIDIGANSRLVSIGRNAFSGNHTLNSIYIPQSLTEIGDSAFNNCGAITFNVASGNTVYRSENGHLIETATQTLIRGANNTNIPDGVKMIAQAAFRRANGITELNIPKSVENIGNYFIADSTIEKINYAGTQSEWEQIEKSSTMWNYGNRNVQVVYESAPTIPADPVNLCEVYMMFDNEIITVQLYDNATARDLVSRLPLTLEFSDYNNVEKIAYLPNGSSALNTSDAPETFTPAAGDLAVYIPWGNISFFYNAFRASSGLAPFGKIGSEGTAKLSQISNNTQITITKEKPSEPEQPADEEEILVVYFSATGTTERVANYIQSYLNADIFEIVPAVPYTSADLDYGDSNSRTSQENRDDNARPAIVGNIENIEQYDIIFIGYPIWHGKAPKVVYTFLEQYDFSGKTIIPFSTAASSGIGSSATYLERLTTGATWLNGTRFLQSSTQSSIQAWVDGILPNNKEN